MTTLFIHHRAPHSGPQNQESLDALLVMAAFGQNPGVLFQGDGVWQLIGEHQTTAFGHASLAAQLQSLPLYDVEYIYVEAESLQQRQLSVEQLALPAKILPRAELAAFIANHHHIIRL